MIYTHAAAALAGASLAAVTAWNVQGWRYGEQIAQIRATQSAELVASVRQARADERANSTKYQEALNAARTRETSLRRAADAARYERDGLRDDLAAANARLSTASAAAVAQYAATAAGLLDQCAGAYQDLARDADGHASDARTLIEAWPGPPLQSESLHFEGS